MNSLRPDLVIIAGAVASGSRVLDVGCGNGDLMAALRAQRRARFYAIGRRGLD